MKRLVAVAAGLVVLSCATPDGADLILVNGQVYTLDEQQLWAEAVAIKAERILAVGSNSEIRRLAGSPTKRIDLEGAFALPGFNDSHVHVDATGALLTGANLLDVHEPVAFTQRIKAASGPLVLPGGGRGERLTGDSHQTAVSSTV
ncbi:MAG: hypothetical protein AMS18_17195 [Gemmatimonas sp. SG8_17]|nr:MAG: hypothetical protein AMS18_17195 [Gemmatimonas sp. SG8_17]